MCLLGYKITCTGWAHSALRVEWRSGGGEAGDAGSSPRAPYKCHLLAVHAPKKMCLLGYKITCTGWAHSALGVEWRRGSRGRRFVTASAVQISSACGKRTKKDVPFGVQNNICLVGTYRPEVGMVDGQPGTQVRHRERRTNIICLRYTHQKRCVFWDTK
jgi:hypothetical protein